MFMPDKYQSKDDELWCMALPAGVQILVVG